MVCHPDGNSVCTRSVLIPVELVSESFVANVARGSPLRRVHETVVALANVLIFELPPARHAHKHAIGRLDN